MNTEKLNQLVTFARQWFVENNVPMPINSKAWHAASIRRKEIPPECNVGNLRKLGTTCKWFIESINGVDNPTANTKIPMDYAALGFILLDHTWEKGHKRCSVECVKCGHREVVDYGTFSRMRDRGDKYCRLCRGVGGKPKPLSIYDRPGFLATEFNDGVVTLIHIDCGKEITRVYQSISKGNSPVCEHCHPEKLFGTDVEIDGILFNSMIEAEVYVKLLKLATEFNFSILRQIPYKDLFPNISSRHTADFYIPEYQIVVEAGGVNTERYRDTMEWKLSLSDKVCYIQRSIQVDDIVRPLLKNRG